MRLPFQAILAAAAVLVVGWLGYQLLFGAGRGAELTVLTAQGDVSRVDDRGRAAVAVGDAVRAGDALQVGDDGAAVIGVGEATRLTLEAGASIQILEVTDGAVRVELEDGAVSARVRPGGPSLGVSSQGRGVVTTDGAFRASRAPDGTFAAEVSEGQVSVEGVEGVTSLPVGQRLTAPQGAPAAVSAAAPELLLQVAWPAPVAVDAQGASVAGETAPYARIKATCGDKACADARADAQGRFSVEVPVDSPQLPVRLEASDAMGQRAETTGDVKRAQPPPPTSAEVVWGR